ncbi:polysaccharide biosynthesis C-terminal domain-containing protein, partial [Thermosynechococcus sp. M98_K2018_005]|uniref:polysaccharide biosynthesis C-terminal domain-containing protein n=1 Tax=Thermosynechococcus sp. M98_K2018_005 TaxID=2747811 RepID=UPI00341A78CC
MWNLPLICFSAVFGKCLLSENEQNLIPTFTSLALIINVIGCLLLIPLWSIKGAALAALASQIIPLIWFGLTDKL